MNRGPYTVRRTENRCGGFDLDAYQKQAILKQGYEDNSAIPGQIGGATGPSGTGYTSTTASGIEDNYFLLDSKFATSRDLSNGEFTVSLTNLNSNIDVQNCIQMALDEMFIPRIAGPVDQPDPFFYRKVFIQIVNAPSTQAILAQNFNRFHYEMNVENINSVAAKLTAVRPIFTFQRPVTSFAEVQLRFFLPDFNRLVLPKDTLTVTAVPGSNPAQFTITGGDNSTHIGPIGVQPVPGVAIFIAGMNSGNAVLDARANSTLGHYVTNVVSNTVIEIAGLNFATVGAPVPATITIGKNRVSFTMRFTSLRNQSTNFIQPIHI